VNDCCERHDANNIPKEQKIEFRKRCGNPSRELGGDMFKYPLPRHHKD
jgi:hypothetical protein